MGVSPSFVIPISHMGNGFKNEISKLIIIFEN